MKNKTIIINSAIIFIMLILGYKAFVLINENTSDDKIRKDVVYHQTMNNDITDKEIENKVVKILETYYKKEKIRENYKVIIRYETQKEIYKYLDRTEENIKTNDDYKEKYSSYIEYINKIKNDINYGIINVFVEPKDKSEQHTGYTVGLNDKTNEILYSSSWNNIDIYSMSKEELIEYEKQVINNKEADKIARKFLIQNNIIDDKNSSYENLELRHDNYNSNYVTLFYKNKDNDLLNVTINKSTKEVIGFALGIQAQLDYIRI
ncbi:hypothetical protein [Tepidibacter hydrothermalis]|uniref:Uncharacterized protein n=1 Tax=Tepidibacter hydrothermalis TaxID=3036126 RepID=A0ABY8EAN8_9FIRM|nr:hypothetical protein [Tepidibacter hydrothermalis]WFD10011.1 hypothetical protein P4S50_16785 [Tepidibacter hydrothermalis]